MGSDACGCKFGESIKSGDGNHQFQSKGLKAKPYKVKQVCNLILKYNWQVKMIKYEVILYWSEEDEAFVAEVPELPGCMADGATYFEALENVEQIAQEWIETARELGREIPVPKENWFTHKQKSRSRCTSGFLQIASL